MGTDVSESLLSNDICPCSEDMISLLGKRPFAGRSDEMDKWLDANPSTGEKDALPSVEETAPPLPVAIRKDETTL